MEGKHLKFPIAKHPRGPYKHHIVVRVDTGADVNCMNEFFPEVQLSVCPHEIQNFGNSVADISILGQFLGVINYLKRYSELNAHLTAPLSALTHQAMDYKPGKVHFENFNRLKVEISNMKALPYFDVNAETTLQMDASKKGLGACLIQKGKVICYALTKTEQNYFLYGKEFILETNQKPLVSIYKKHMIDNSLRVQRLIVRSFPYLPFKVVYKKGIAFQLQMHLIM